MKQIITIEQAENFINNYDLYQSKAENQTNLFTILEKCESLAIANHNNKLLCQIRIFLTNYYIQINDLENALKIGLENKNFSETEKLEEENLRTYSGLVEIYNSIGDYVKMEEIIQEYQKKLMNKNDYSKLCTLFIILAMQSSNLKKYANSLEHNHKAIEYAKLSKNVNLIIYAYNNFGSQFLDYDLQVAKDALENALKIIELHDNEIPGYSKAIVELNSSRLYLKLLNYDLSLQLIKSSVKRLKKINNHNEINSANLVLSELYIKLNKLRPAFKLLKEIENKCLETNNRTVLLNTYQCLIQLFEKKNKYMEALEYYKKYQAVNEEIYNEETNKKIYNIQTLYEVTDLKRQRDHAETVANLKHDFLANMSHEIRTPINSVLGISYLLQQSHLNEKQTDYVQRLQRSGENLLSLINDILDISKIEAGKMIIASGVFNLKTFLKDIQNQLSYRAKDKNLKLIFNLKKESDISVIGDVNRMTQIITNLVTNAIKFTNEGIVSVDIKFLSKDKNQLIVEFKISDSGIGISPDKLTTIFERYEQATTKNSGGTGLGLSISKKLTELMSGKIEVSSVLNKGTIFTVTIPFELNPDKEITKNEFLEIPAEFLKNKHILIADDIEENRLILKEILQNFNNEVCLAEAVNGIEVLTKINQMPYDLILMDLDMPEKDGIETMKEIRNNDKFKHLKIMAHTASLLTISYDDMIKTGFDDLLLKPFNPNEFLKKLIVLLN